LLAASPDPSDSVAPGALALSPDQLVNDTADEKTSSKRSEPVKNKPVAFNPFAADKENATGAKSTPPTFKSPSQRFHRRFARPADVAPLSPLSLLNVR
jgi:hypothetical protein